MKKLLMMIGAAAVAVGAFAAASTPPSTLVDLTTTGSDASGAVDSASTTGTGSYHGTRAFDGTSKHENSRWLPQKADDMWVIYAFNVPTVVDSIRIYLPTSGELNQTARAPKDWTFLGSNDKSTWALLDTQTDETNWSSSSYGESRFYKFDNTSAYKYYKFNCTANNGATDYMQLQEIEFYCVGNADSTWTGGGTTDLLSDVANWGGTSMPGSECAAYIENTSATPAVVPGGLTVYKNLRVGNSSGKSAKVVQTNGTFRVLNGVTIGRNGGAGEYSISGGKLVSAGEYLYMSANNGRDVGVLDISGDGEVEARKITMFYNASAGSTATINISENGRLSLTEAFDMGYAGNATTGMVYQTGGTCELTSIFVGNNNKSYGEYKMAGGTCSAGSIFIGYNSAGGSGLFEMTGGTCAVSDMMSVGRYGTGTLAISGVGTVLTANTVRVGFTNGGNRGTGTLVVTNGGEIATTQLYAGAGASATNQATVTFNGGKLTATAANAEFMKDLLNIQLEAGGLTIDTQGKALGISNCTFNVTGNGKITVVGGGTVTFTNVTVYMAEKPQGAYVFAETDGTFSGLPNLGGIKGCKISLSSDYKRVTVSPRGFIITVF